MCKYGSGALKPKYVTFFIEVEPRRPSKPGNYTLYLDIKIKVASAYLASPISSLSTASDGQLRSVQRHTYFSEYFIQHTIYVRKVPTRITLANAVQLMSWFPGEPEPPGFCGREDIGYG